jgi:hypothetical protein
VNRDPEVSAPRGFQSFLARLATLRTGKLGELIGVGAGTLASGLVHAASFVLSIVVVLLFYRFVPSRGIRFRDGLVGAIVTALLLRLISLRLGLDLREDNQAQRRLRLAHIGVGLPLLDVSLLLRLAPRCRGSCRMLAAAASGGRADPDAAETRPARTLRQAEGLAGR